MSNEEIQRQVMELFDRLVADISHPQYLEVVEDLACDFESRYNAAREEANKMEEGDDD